MTRILVFCLLCSASVAACGGGGGDDDGNGAADAAVADAPQLPDAPPPVDAAPPDAPPAPDAMADCASMGGQCQQCCVDTNPDAYAELIGYVTMECGCTAGATCEMQCQANVCAGMQPDQACIDCINNVPNQDACIQSTINKCVGSATCVPVLACFQGC